MNKLPEDLTYFNVSKYWDKLNPIYETDEIKEIALYKLNAYLKVKAKDDGYTFKPLTEFVYPCDYNSDFWICDGRKRRLKYFNWVLHRACHWMAPINLEVIVKALPDREWRLVYSDFHSTVFDGKRTVYDLNYKAWGVPITELRDGINNDPSLCIDQPYDPNLI